ncbi:MAG: hypothetical protein VBE63_06435 [Lamprobacter sp.]|uniref:hypothetical protein n=1 Tax=Lamprobacter sp. TaxID=3100796 RepID=UPI002B256EF8|nr:hypothetical protein [Lamprobacter sp.]MEA3639564.1 hypothetical protein [Lamprobacter sp.]
MFSSMIATHRLRGAQCILAMAGVVLASTSIAGVHQGDAHQSACLNTPMTASQTATQEVTRQVRLQGGPGPGLLALVRSIAPVRPDLLTSAHRPQHLDQATLNDQGPLSDQALRERIARYQLSPTRKQRHAALPSNSGAHCPD